MALILRTFTVVRHRMLIAFLRVLLQETFQFKRLPNLRWSSI